MYPQPAPRKGKSVPAGGFMMTAAGAAAPRGGMAYPPPPAWGGRYGSPLASSPSVPQNPTTMSTYGGSTQQTDQMGRVITTTPGSQRPGIDPATGMWTGTGGGQMGSTVIEDPDLIRRSRDLADTQARVSMRPPAAADDGEEDLRKYFSYIKTQFQPPPREAPMDTPARVTGEPEADRRAAEAAEFGRAKDRVAKIARGAGKSLEADMIGRGLVGSGIEARNMRDIVRGGQGDLANVATEQALASLQRRNQVADRNYAGDVSQRSQDIGIGATNLGAGVSQRSQDISAQQNLLSMVPSLAALSRRRVVLR